MLSFSCTVLAEIGLLAAQVTLPAPHLRPEPYLEKLNPLPITRHHSYGSTPCLFTSYTAFPLAPAAVDVGVKYVHHTLLKRLLLHPMITLM